MSIKKETKKCEKSIMIYRQKIKSINKKIEEEYGRHKIILSKLLSEKQALEKSFKVVEEELINLYNEGAKRENLPEENW